jgi:arylsulfatase A-like enzyme
MAETDKDKGSQLGKRNRRSGGNVVLALFAIVLAYAAFFGGKEKSADPGKVVASGDAAGFNVLFITLDTTKPDHLGCYGYPQANTPAIDALAAHGMRFTDAVTSVPLTLPSHSVMMTGQYPPTIGVRQNGNHLRPESVTLAEVLSSNGYETAAFVGTFVLDERFGLSQGFDTYDFKLGRDSDAGMDSLMGERRADEVSSSAINWLKQRKKNGANKPFFCWLHYYDPHHPYDSPLADTDQFKDRPLGAYDAEIALVDVHLKRVFDTLKQQGLTDNTLVVLTTDHGEAFGEKGEAYHGIFVYECTMHSAIIFSNPALFDKAHVVSDRVAGTVDLFPTIMDLLGMAKSDQLEGVSLLSPLDPDRAVYIETQFPLSNACHPFYGIRRHRDKFIEAPQSEYYNLQDDPGENVNLIATSEARAAQEQFELFISRWGENFREGGGSSLSEEERAALEALGYTGLSADSGTELVDCKDHIEIINMMTDVTKLKALGQIDEAIELAKQVEAESNCWYPPIKNLAELYRDSGKPLEAQKVFERFLHGEARGQGADGDANINSNGGCPPEPEMLYHYATLLFYELNDLDGAMERLAHANQIDPRLGVAYMLRAKILESQERFQEAEEQYQLAMERDVRAIDDARAALEQLHAQMAKD